MSASVDRALDLLEAVAHSDEPVGLIDLAATVGMDKSTASRHVAALVARGMLRRNPQTRKVSVGDRTVAMSSSVLRRSTLRSAAFEHLTRLRDRSGETASLALRVGHERICIAVVESAHEMRRVVNVGETVPLHHGVCGAVLLAALPSAQLHAALVEAARAGADMEELHARVLAARRTGYSSAEGLRVPGVAAIASAVMASGTDQVAALVLAGPSSRFGVDAMRDVAPDMIAAADALSAAAPYW